MLRSIVTAALQTTLAATYRSSLTSHALQPTKRLFSSAIPNGFSYLQKNALVPIISKTFLAPPQCVTAQERTVTKFSLNKGKRKSVKAVIKRFKRLDWGCWIRTHSGRHKKLFKKSPALRRRLKQHVLVNATQSWLLDKMVTSYWRKPKYYIDDPYEPYHKREEYWSTRKKPVQY